MTRPSPICPRCRHRLAVGATLCPRCGVAPTASTSEASPSQAAVPPWRNQRWQLGTFSLVIGIAVLLGIVSTRVLDADSTPTPISDRGAVTSVTTDASPVSTDASPMPAVPTITEDLPPLPTLAASPEPGSIGEPLPILTPFLIPDSAATPALEPLRPDRVPAAAQPATVVEIVNGHVIKVLLGESEETVRLLGIDTPETTDPFECFGAEAFARTAKTIPVGTVVWLEVDATDRDSSGRLLRYVWFVREANGRTYMLNERLLAEGYAVISIASPDVKYVERFERAQTLAQDEGRGLWPTCGGADAPLATLTPAP